MFEFNKGGIEHPELNNFIYFDQVLGFYDEFSKICNIYKYNT